MTEPADRPRLSTLGRLRARLELARLDRHGIAADVRKRRLTYLSKPKLLQIIRALKAIEAGNIPGACVEAGCALGGSLLVIEKYAGARPIHAYDTFEMIPPPGENDPPDVHERYRAIEAGESEGIGGDEYYGYQTNLIDTVRKNLIASAGADVFDRVSLHKGLLQDTMSLDGPVAFAHVDVDWYDPVLYCLDHLWPRLSPGGIIILDDYFDWGGCRKAADAFLSGRTDYATDPSLGSLKITKH